MRGGFSNLFTDKEKMFLDQYHACSPTAQLIFARLLTRKRVWYTVQHLKQYADDAQVQQAVAELIDNKLLMCESTVLERLMLDIEANLEQPDHKVELEPFALILSQLSVPQLQAIGKVATKCIRKVQTKERADCQDVCLNPFYRLSQQEGRLQDCI